MKKLFSMAVIFIMVLTLVGCSTSEVDDLQLKIDELNQDIWDINLEMGNHIIANTVLEDEVSELEVELAELEEELALLQSKMFDNTIIFSFVDEYGNLSNKTIGYEDEFDGTLFDLLDSNFSVGYSESEWGKYIYSIDNLSPKNGAFISFSRNGIPSMVGVELSEFEDRDNFIFEIKWYNALEHSVDDVIHLFLFNHASDYVNSESIDYNVLLALSLLGITEEYVSVIEVEAIVESYNLVTTADYFKAIMILNSVGSDSSELIAELNLIVAPGIYGQTAYGLLAMDSISTVEDYSLFVTLAMADLEATTPYDLGLDAGGISLVALSNYSGFDTLISDYTTWISTSKLDSGGVLTRDVIWGETTYPGNENAASMSQVILGLIANGIDPTGVDYTKGDNNLISRILEFSTKTGSFDYVLDDEIYEDLFFSTPQAFLALVTYQIYSNTFTAVNPYNFN